ncbi:FtsH protease activity modulator HflK [Rhodobacter sp. Har01]|uniref:FtsH protease activity modulator HflK n=1 Tax=Rhodobacter sp. Har01 TaxID=2883999 RepID=UPI001D098494|nr:FtsH protease activity modulator HflK [Rhodobacter sp. Har01]MCB6178850.1 FtsH protease activity modulator HflK [Rhodobacter sp. Har01]
MAGSGGPWGGGGGDDDGNGGRGGRNDDDKRGGPRRPGEGGGPQIPEIDEIMRKGQEQLRVLMGGRGRGNGPRGPSPEGGSPLFSGRGLALGALALVAAWSFMSFYQVNQEERSVELFLGESSGVGQPGLNFAPWPVVTYEKVLVTGERNTEIGTGQGADVGLMLTRDQNIVDIGFQVVWNISDPEKYLFNLADPEGTIRAVSESAMRDIIARSELSPILNRDRGVISSDLRTAVQATLDSYNAGINVIRVNLQRAQPPADVIDAFREVQAAQQERDRLEKEADAYANRVTAGARGEVASVLENAEAYRAQAVNSAQGEAARFLSVFAEYVKAPEVTRRRLYLETMEKVLGGIDKVILDGVSGGVDGAGQGVVPFLPLNEMIRSSGGAAAAAGGTN